MLQSMPYRYIILTVCIMLLLYHAPNLLSQEETDSTVTDYDGNVYPIVQIGDQIWLAENLRSIHYSDGTPIEYSPGMDSVPMEDTTKRYFYYDDDPSHAGVFGCLYTWYAAIRGVKGDTSNPASIQGISPEGWHIPSVAEWRELAEFLNGSTDPLKPGGWTGFNAVYGGLGGDYNFQQMHEGATYITSDPGMDYDLDIYTDTWLAFVRPGNSELLIGMHRKTCGYSVRCVKDETSSGLGDHTSTKTPEKIELLQNYPNPFNPVTTIQYSIKQSGQALLTIYNIQGQWVETLVNEFQTAGEHEITWQPTGLPSGIYYYQLKMSGHTKTKKMLLLK